MTNKTPLNCPHCKQVFGYQEDFMYYVISYPGVVCIHCGEIAIPYMGPMCTSGGFNET